MAIPDASIFFKWDDMDVSRSRHTGTILRMMTLTGFPSMKPVIREHLKGGRKAAVIDPSFHSKIRQQNVSIFVD